MNNFKFVEEKEFLKIYEEEIVGDRANAVLVLTVNYSRSKKPVEDRDERIRHAYLLQKKMREQFAERVTCPIYIVDVYAKNATDELVEKFEVNRMAQLPCVILFENGKMTTRHFAAGSDGEYLDGIIKEIKKL